MAICKFYQQGTCKFGNRCYNEHVRSNSQNQGNTRQHQAHNDQYRNTASQFNQPRNRNQQNNSENYRSPFNRGGNSNYTSPSIKSNTQNSNDKFHWTSKSQSNRFSVLSEPQKQPQGNHNQQDQAQANSSQTDHASMFKTISEDMALWPSSKLWPFSCYCYAMGKQCIEGLADIQPEEIRVLYYLHGVDKYRSILEEVELIYARRKEELRYMADDTKAALLVQMESTVESNPSSSLSIYSLYGPGTDFKPAANENVAIGTPLGEIKVLEHEQLPQTNVFKTATPPATTLTPITPPGSSNTHSAPPSEGALGHVFKSTPTGAVNPKVVPTGTVKDATYTDKTDLTAGEIQQFEAQTFTLGKIPMRPPPKEFCR
uniref:Nucleoporin NUP42 n=1 Tax=Ciona savignyi TaxID=51511 RepID=H2YUG3_CIOSA